MRGRRYSAPVRLLWETSRPLALALGEAALFERYLAARAAARASGAITLLLSHRFSTVRMADLIVVLDGGGIIETGDHATLVRAGGLYAEPFELQARAYR